MRPYILVLYYFNLIKNFGEQQLIEKYSSNKIHHPENFAAPAYSCRTKLKSIEEECLYFHIYYIYI